MPLPMWPMYITSRYFHSKRGNQKKGRKKKGRDCDSYYTRYYLIFLFLNNFFFFWNKKRKRDNHLIGPLTGPGLLTIWALSKEPALRKVNFNTGVSHGKAKWASMSHLVTLCTEAQMPTRQQNHRRGTFPTRFTTRSGHDDTVRVNVCRLGILSLAIYAHGAP